MRFHRAVSLTAILSAGWYFGCHRKAGAQDPADDLVLAIFDNRALKPKTRPVGSDPNLELLYGSDIAKAYTGQDFHPERSVLLFDCADTGWCSNPDFSFESMFKVTARLLNSTQPDSETLAQSWRDEIVKLDSSFGDILQEKAQFQLLAIANRMDTAGWEKEVKTWRGAEIHLVYGLVPLPDAALRRLTLIVEFELADFDRVTFQKLGQAWYDLSKLPYETPADKSTFAGKLREVLRMSGLQMQDGDPQRIKRARIRMNDPSSGDAWLLTQLVLDPAKSATLTPADLDDELSGEISASSKVYAKLWRQAEQQVVKETLEYRIPPELLGDASVDYGAKNEGMGMPSGPCNSRKDVRNVLSLQRCTFCHTIETGTEFTHIPNRDPKDSTKPSAFLIGKNHNPKPSLEELYYGEGDAVPKVLIPYESYTGPPGKPCTIPVSPQAVESRQFHDVARRSLFLAAVVAEKLPGAGNSIPKADKLSTHSIE